VKAYCEIPGRQEQYPALLWMNHGDIETTKDHLQQFSDTTKLTFIVGPAKPPLKLRNGLDARLLSLEPRAQTRNQSYEVKIGSHPQNQIILNI